MRSTRCSASASSTTPASCTTRRRFQKAASDVDYTFNWFYADSKDISYYSSGLLPKRSKKVEPDLPHWAGKKYDWKGWLPVKKHARETNPKRGYLVSWNNKPAPDFSAADDTWSYGAVYRSQALEKRLLSKIRGKKKVDLPGMVGVMAGGATADSRAAYTLPWLLKVIGNDPKTAPARALLSQWLKAGTPRADRDRNGSYEFQAAIALFDSWWEDGQSSVAYDAMSGRLGSLTRLLPQGLDDHPRSGQGSSFNGVAWYGYLSKDLRSVLGKKVAGPYSMGYCGKGSLKACRTTLRASLAAAVARVLQKQGKSSVGQLTYDKAEDYIRSNTAGVVGVRPDRLAEPPDVPAGDLASSGIGSVLGVAVPTRSGQKARPAQAVSASGMAAISSRTRSAAIVNAGSAVTRLTAASIESTA